MNPNQLFLGLTFALIWSSAFTSAKIAMYYAPPFLLLSVRFFISGVLGILIAKAIGQKVLFSRTDWQSIIVFGLCQNTIYLGLNFMAMQWINASLAAIIASLLPLIVAFFSWIFFKQKISFLAIFGLILGLVGISLIMQHKVPEGNEFFGICLCFGGALSLAIATIVLNQTSGENILMMVGLQMLIGSLTLFPISLFFESWTVHWTWSLVLSFLYTTLFPGLIATVIWFKLLKEIGPIKAAAFHFLNPFFGVLIATIFLHETLVKTDIIGVLIVMTGILFVQLNKKVS
jgi:drug/metabolite transporter (DMT)-like permease